MPSRKKTLDRTRRTEMTPLSMLVPASENPKLHDDALMDASIGRFGFVEPIVLDERTGQIVAGHGRLAALRRAEDRGDAPPDGVEVTEGEWWVPVARGWASASDAEALAAGIALNRIGEAGGWNRSMLAEILDGLRAASPLDGIGFSTEDVDALLARSRSTPPPEFPPVDDDDLRTEHVCPRCGFEF